MRTQWTSLSILLLIALAALRAPAAERINHEGRILGPAPTVSAPTLFNTTDADAIVSAMQIFPVDNALNEDISKRPLLIDSKSDDMIAQITADLTNGFPTRNTLRMFQEMNFVLVPDNQPNVDVNLLDYPTQSDDVKPSTTIGSFPVPSNQPIESWPFDTGLLTLQDWQKDINGDGGDRHGIVVQPGTGYIWETWQMKLTTNTPAWEASNDAKFNLNSNALRPDKWTSGDAAGLPMFAMIVRYDECERGMVEHAMRIVVKRSRNNATNTAHIYPATHDAGSTQLADVPAMGQRVRLKSTFDIPAAWSKQEKAVALALKKYGALVADNGNFFSISVAPDTRFPTGCWDNINHLLISNFEVIQTTGASEGPRSAGKPTSDAGSDQSVAIADGAQLSGSVTGTGVTSTWYVYPGSTPPGTVTFGNAASASTSATFSAIGTYTLMLKADDGVHTPAYDAVVITVANQASPPPPGSPAAPSALAAVGVSASGIDLTWTDNSSDETGFKIERSPNGTSGWTALAQPAANATSYHDTGLAAAATWYYRIRATNGNGDSANSAVASATTSSDGTGGGSGSDPNAPDSDNDGVSDADEVSAGTNPLDANSFPITPMTLLKAFGGVNFVSGGKDSISVSGIIPALPALFDPTKRILVVDAAGVKVSFTLDPRGHAKNAGGTLMLRMKFKRNRATKKLEFSGGDVPFSAKLIKGSFATTLSAAGFDNSVHTKAPVPLTLYLHFNGKVYGDTQTLSYTAKAGKSGRFKK